MLEGAHGTPCCPRGGGGGLTHLPSKAFDFIQAEKPLGSSVLPQLLPKSLQACGTRGEEMHFNPLQFAYSTDQPFWALGVRTGLEETPVHVHPLPGGQSRI